MVDAAEALRPLLKKTLPLLRDIPVPEGVAEFAYFGDKEKQRAAQTSSAPLRDRRWLQHKLARIIPAHHELVAGLEALWKTVSDDGTRDQDYWELTTHGEDLGVLARLAWDAALGLTQTYELLWVALLLAQKFDGGDAAAEQAPAATANAGAAKVA
jgi:hypothetical protein